MARWQSCRPRHNLWHPCCQRHAREYKLCICGHTQCYAMWQLQFFLSVAVICRGNMAMHTPLQIKIGTCQWCAGNIQ